MDKSKSVKYEKKKTNAGEWITIAIIVVVIVLGFLLVWFVYVPKLFTEKATTTPSLPTPKGCPVSVSPSGLTANQFNTVKPNVDLAWGAVLQTTTPGEQILGYNIYASITPGITEASKQKAGFTVVPEKRLYSTAQGPVKSGVTYYFVVTTIDSCGESPISTEVSFTPA